MAEPRKSQLKPIRMPCGPYRLYIDESGDHAAACATSTPDKRYLGLMGVIFTQSGHREFAVELDSFKRKNCSNYDPDDPPILHREDVIGKQRSFRCLREDGASDAFYSAFVRLTEGTEFTAITVVVDKYTHGRCTYRVLTHPYHYCMHAMIERYVHFLEDRSAKGDVLAEARGGREDRALKDTYRDLLAYGTRFCKAKRIADRLSSIEIKIKPKQANVAGLQLADMLAFGATRDVLVAYRSLANWNPGYLDRSLVDRLAPKYLTRYDKVNGYERVILR